MQASATVSLWQMPDDLHSVFWAQAINSVDCAISFFVYVVFSEQFYDSARVSINGSCERDDNLLNTLLNSR